MPNDKQLTPTGRFPRSEPNMQNIPGSAADAIDKMFEAGLIHLGTQTRRVSSKDPPMTNKPKPKDLGEIFKIQKPLFSNIPTQTYLIYNRSRSIMMELPATKDVGKLFPRDVYKIYAYAKIAGTTLEIMGRAPNQDW